MALLVALGMLVISQPQPAFATGFVPDHVFGQSGSYTTENCATSQTVLCGAFDVAVDSVNHRLFVSDFWSNRVLVYNLDANNNFTDDTADHVLGQLNFTAPNAATTQSGMSRPTGLAFDSTHNRLFVADASNDRVLVFNTASITDGMNAAKELGQPDFTSSGAATTQSGFDGVSDVAYDSVHDRLYVGEYYNSRVLAFNVSTITDGMNAINVIGQPDFVSSNSNLTQSGLRAGQGVAFDGSRYLYVADSLSNRVLAYDMNALSDGMNASYVLGQANYSSNTSATTRAGLDKPVAVDATGTMIYVAEENNNRVVAYDKSALANGMNASSVIGQPDFTSAASGLSSTTLDAPQGVAFDPTSGNLYVADTNNNRLLSYSVAAVSNSTTSVTVDPSFVFTVAGRASVCNGQSATNFQTGATATAVSMGHLTSATVGGGAQDLSVATNAANGFVVYLHTSGTTPHSLRDGNGHSIADVSGTNASPGSAPVAGTAGFGYTSSDASTPFTSNTWAKLVNSNDSVLLGSAGTTSKSACIGYEVAIATTTPAGNYSSNVIYTAVPGF